MGIPVNIETEEVSLMITFFACPKPFEGHIDTIQRNAIRSWTLLKPRPEIILLGIDKGVAEICKEFGLIHIPDISRNEYGTPLVSSIFEIGQARASHSVVCYINSDIMLTNDFLRAIEIVVAKMPRFLVLGQRTDIDIKEAWNFDAAVWEVCLKNLLEQKGTLHAPTGIDFFCFPRGMYSDIPPFAIGRFAWDCWLVWYVRMQGFPIVDITEAVPIAHQNHGYAPDKIRKLDAQTLGSKTQGRAADRILRFNNSGVGFRLEVQRNAALVPEEQYLNIWAATWRIDRKGRLGHRWIMLKPAYLYYQLKCVVPAYWPAFGRVFRWIKSVAKTLLQFGTAERE